MYLLVRRLSRRYGTGASWRTCAGDVERRDIWPGIGTAVLALVVTAIVVNIVRSVLGLPVDATDQFGSLDDTTATRMMIAVAAVIGAPLFEELLFRGVVLHALLALGPGRGDPRQLGCSSGCTPPEPRAGPRRENVRARRVDHDHRLRARLGGPPSRALGPSMVAHAAFNLLAVTLLFASWPVRPEAMGPGAGVRRRCVPMRDLAST